MFQLISQIPILFPDSICLNPLASPFRNEGRGAVPSLLKGGWGILFLLAGFFDTIEGIPDPLNATIG